MNRVGFLIYMRKEGFEPSSLAAHAPQTCAYASSATSANGVVFYHITRKKYCPVRTRT